MKTIPALFILLILFSCNSSSPSDKNKTVFNYNEPSGITSLDPAFARSQANLWAVSQIFNGLLQLDDSLEIQPCIARSWSVSSDGKEYIFHLRDDIYFQDDTVFKDGKGRKVIASDFVYSFSRIVSPTVVSPGAWVFGHVKKADNAFVAKDDSTFIISLESPFPPFPGLLTMQYCSVVPKEVVTHYGKDFRIHPVGTGPFCFKLWKEGVKLILIKNQNYFEKENGTPLPYLDAVSISFLPDRETAFMEFLQGKLDFLSGIEGAYKDRILTQQGTLQQKFESKFKLLVSPYLNTEYLGFLMDEDPKNPLTKKEVRQAVSSGFDRAAMISFLRNNIGTPANSGFVPKGLPSFDDQKVQGYGFDLAKAGKLLSKAGFPGGKGMPEIALGTVASYADYCSFIQSQLKELGIKMKMEVNQDAMNRELVAKGKQKFFRGSWIADYPDAENFLSLFYSKNFSPKGPNTTHFSNKKYDGLYERSLTENDVKKRYELYRSMDQILIEEAPVVVLYYDQAVRLVQNNIENFNSNAMNFLSLKSVKKINSAEK